MHDGVDHSPINVMWPKHTPTLQTPQRPSELKFCDEMVAASKGQSTVVADVLNLLSVTRAFFRHYLRWSSAFCSPFWAW